VTRGRAAAAQLRVRDRSLRSGRQSGLKTLEQVIVVCVGADPEPDPVLIGTGCQGSILECYPGGVDRFRVVNLLDSKTRMPRILGEQFERLAGSILDIRR
jgi:hypothetical protein